MSWISDRGRGFLSSLKRVAPELITDQQAIDYAFKKAISGRAPERRGNGLKFVRSAINGNSQRGLVAYSGKGIMSFGGLTFFFHLQ